MPAHAGKLKASQLSKVKTLTYWCSSFSGGGICCGGGRLCGPLQHPHVVPRDLIE